MRGVTHRRKQFFLNYAKGSWLIAPTPIPTVCHTELNSKVTSKFNRVYPGTNQRLASLVVHLDGLRIQLPLPCLSLQGLQPHLKG